MFKAIGVVIILWYLSSLFTNTFKAMDSAFAASFRSIETAATAPKELFVR